ncbi:DUF397 domain-containing protein [Streptomyces sp. NPDC002491]
MQSHRPSPTRRHSIQHRLPWPKPHSPCPKIPGQDPSPRVPTTAIYIRDSKIPDGPNLTVAGEAWAAFLFYR